MRVSGVLSSAGVVITSSCPSVAAKKVVYTVPSENGRKREYHTPTMTLINCSLSIHDFIKSFRTFFRTSSSVTS